MLKDVCVHDGYTGIQDFNIDRGVAQSLFPPTFCLRQSDCVSPWHLVKFEVYRRVTGKMRGLSAGATVRGWVICGPQCGCLF